MGQTTPRASQLLETSDVKLLTAAERTKLAGIATGATANSTDAQLRDRSTHTGAQAQSTVTDLVSDLAAKAPLASPALTGVPTVPTATAGTSTTQAASTAFVQAAISGVTGSMELMGDLDASTNPNYPAASKGDTYVVTVAGKVGGASGTSVDVGDLVVAKVDNAGGSEASVGSSWFTVEHNLVGALLAGNNLSDVADAATAFGNIKQAATESATGVVELATTGEAVTGTDTSRAVTAAGVAAALAALTAKIVDSEAVGGTVDGTNAEFTLAYTPAAGSVHLMSNGIRLKAGSGNDYTISGLTITFEGNAATNVNFPVGTDDLTADYRKA